MKYGYFVKKVGGNVVVDRETIEDFMYVFFEMTPVDRSDFYMGGYRYKIFSYHSTEDIYLVRYMLNECVVINCFADLGINYPDFANLEENVITMI